MRRVVGGCGEVKVILRMWGASWESRTRVVWEIGVEEEEEEVIDWIVERKAGTRVLGSRWAWLEGTALRVMCKSVAVISCVLIFEIVECRYLSR